MDFKYRAGKKKNGKIRVWVDFWDLNNFYPKYDFSFPITKIMIDGTISHERLTFIDGLSGYNQIWMVPTYEKIAFQTLKGIYCHEVIPFGLKNTCATYQRAMQKIFDDMLH